MTTTNALPTLFIPHGGGPCFFMDWPSQPDMWNKMGDFLRNLHTYVGRRPKAIVVVSAHWVAEEFTVMAGAHPPLIFDYYGFPEHTYRLTYPAPGAPELAKRIQALLREAGFATKSDSERGFDHGTFIPFKLIYPDADIPIVQLSLKTGLDPAEHLRAGKALQALRDEGVLIVGSGMSFHNMRGFTPAFTEVSQRFDDWLTAATSEPDADARNRLLERWEQAPDARLTQPHPDHLLPLMVAVGAAGGDAGRKIFEDKVMNVVVSGFAFG
jgi:aromatic ring-opening dioxygenase catalytic subunit (LigB family)